MKILNRVWACILCVVLTIGICAFAAPAAIPDDALGSPWQQEIEFVLALHIMRPNDDLEFVPEGLVTRADFALTVIRMLNMEALNLSGSGAAGAGAAGSDEWMGSSLSAALQQARAPMYSDVPFDYPAYSAINLVTALNLMSGDGMGAFLPEEAISYQQALAVMVRMVGLGHAANANGGYPVGYIQLAMSRALALKDISNYQMPINRGILAALAARCVDIDLVMQQNYGADVSYKTHRGKTILTERLQVAKVKGIVTANEFTGLYDPAKNVRRGYVAINNAVYYNQSWVTQDMLGKRVSAYYSTAQGTEDHLLYVSRAAKDNRELIIEADQFGGYSGNTFTYFDPQTNHSQKEKILASAPAIFNGVYYDILDAFTPEELNGLRNDSCTLRLLDYDNDGTYDVIFIDRYDTYIVRKTDYHYKKLYVSDVTDGSRGSDSVVASDGVPEPLDFNDSSVTYRFFRDGIPAEITSAKEGFVLSVAQSMNLTGKKLVDVHISTVNFSGVLSEIRENIFVVDAKEYKKVPGAGIELQIGMSGSFYLDILGNIAAFNGSNAGYDYGYVMSYGQANGIAKDVRIQMFVKSTQDVEVVSFAKNVRITGGNTKNKSYNDHDRLYAALQDVFENINNPFGDVDSKLIAFKRGQDGFIYEIVTVTVYNTWPGTGSASAIHAKIDRSPVGILSTYTNQEKTDGPGVKKNRSAIKPQLFSDFILSTGGVVFDLSSSNTDDWCIRPASSISSGTTLTNGAAYNLGAANVADIVVTGPAENYGTSADIRAGAVSAANEKPVFISKLSTIMDENGNEVLKITGFKDNNLVEYQMDPARGAGFIYGKSNAGGFPMRIGDAWLFEVNAKNQVITANQLLSVEIDFTDYSYYARTPLTNLNFQKAIGLVKEVAPDALLIALDKATNGSTFTKPTLWLARLNLWGANSTFVFSCDVKRKIVERKTTADITVGDTVFTFVRGDDEVPYVMIIKNFN